MGAALHRERARYVCRNARGISSNGTMTHAGIRSCEPVGSGGRYSEADRCGRFACRWCSRSERDGVDGPCQPWFVSSRGVDAVRRCRTLTVARARRRQRVCDCGGRRHCAADCAAPLTCRGSSVCCRQCTEAHQPEWCARARRSGDSRLTCRWLRSRCQARRHRSGRCRGRRTSSDVAA